MNNSKKEPMISVIIPVYNRVELLPESINSVINQTYKNYEIIIIDDGSSTDIKRIIQKFKNPNIKYVKHNKNKGAAVARNTGIKVSKGKYIAFQDSDDEWHPEKLEKQMKKIRNTPKKIGVVYTGNLKYYKNGQKYIPDSTIKKKEGNIHNELLRRSFIATDCLLLKRECFNKCDNFDVRLPRLQDWELCIRLSKYYNFLFIDEPLLISNYSPTSISENKQAYIKAMEIILKKHSSDFAKNKNNYSKQYMFLGNANIMEGNLSKGRKNLNKAFKIKPSLKMFFLIIISLFGKNIYNLMLSKFS